MAISVIDTLTGKTPDNGDSIERMKARKDYRETLKIREKADMIVRRENLSESQKKAV